MIERIVSLDPQKAYGELKILLIINDHRISKEEPSKLSWLGRDQFSESLPKVLRKE